MAKPRGALDDGYLRRQVLANELVAAFLRAAVAFQAGGPTAAAVALKACRRLCNEMEKSAVGENGTKVV